MTSQENINFKNLKEKLLFIPIGGCDWIGTNLYLYHYNGEWIAIDCGIGFADQRENPGANVLIPDLSFLEKNKIKLSALIITHSHEDHIGAICNVYKQLKCPIYLSTFAKYFLESDMMEAKIDKSEIKIIDFNNKKKFKIGSFDIEMIYMTHSAIESHAVFIKTPSGSVFHSGDWRIDPNPVVGEKTDIERLTQLGEKREVATLICDSTNCMKEKPMHSESDLETDILSIVKEQKGMVVLTTFASSIGRIQLISDIAKKTGRMLVVSGHSMLKIIAIAQKSGYLENVEYIDNKEAKKFPRNKLLVLATGCQGEKMATVAKLANNKHNFLKITGGDAMIFSSSTIPGNEIGVFDIINKFIEKDVLLYTNKDYNIHTSGHPYRSDLKYLYSLLQPKCLIPMHGDWLMLHEHIKFAKSCGIKKALSSKNGVVFNITNDNIETVGKLETHTLCLDGNRLIDKKSKVFTERVKIAENGIIMCNLVVNGNGKIVCHPNVKSVGFFERTSKEDLKFIKELEKKITKAIEPSFFSKKKKVEVLETKEKITKIISKEIFQTYEKQCFIEVELFVV